MSRIAREYSGGRVFAASDDRDGGPPGSRIVSAFGVFALSAWPDRITDVHALSDGLVVTFRDGTSRLLQRDDALRQP